MKKEYSYKDLIDNFREWQSNGVVIDGLTYTDDGFECVDGSMYKAVIKSGKVRSIVGSKTRMSNRQYAEVIVDRGSRDIDIEFEDKTVVSVKGRITFVRGNVANPNVAVDNIFGEERVMNNGQRAKVIADRGSADIDVQFEDGTVAYNQYRCWFELGRVKNPNCDRAV